MHFLHPFNIVSFHDVMHMQGGYEWLLVLQPVQRSLQNPNIQLERTPLQLVLPCSSQQCLNHLACCRTPTVDRISSAVLRGVSHEGRLIGRGA